MTYSEMLLMNASAASKPKKKHNKPEEELQTACLKWFRLQYPKMEKVLVANPNGGSRNFLEACNMKRAGVTAGVADLTLYCKNRFYGTLLIEMKTPKGRQQESQKAWQKEVEKYGQHYVVCRSLEDFMREVKEYLKNT